MSNDPNFNIKSFISQDAIRKSIDKKQTQKQNFQLDLSKLNIKNKIICDSRNH